MGDNLGAVFSSYVVGKQMYENIPDCKMQVSSRATLKLSRPEVLAFFELLCKNSDDGSIYRKLRAILQQSETRPFIPPEPQ